jgi:hypothetical protein
MGITKEKRKAPTDETCVEDVLGHMIYQDLMVFYIYIYLVFVLLCIITYHVLIFYFDFIIYLCHFGWSVWSVDILTPSFVIYK